MTIRLATGGFPATKSVKNALLQFLKHVAADRRDIPLVLLTLYRYLIMHGNNLL
jgi:hypothetical protein